MVFRYMTNIFEAAVPSLRTVLRKHPTPSLDAMAEIMDRRAIEMAETDMDSSSRDPYINTESVGPT